MNYIIHQFGNLDEQIHTCLLVSREEDEDRADTAYLRNVLEEGAFEDFRPWRAALDPAV